MFYDQDHLRVSRPVTSDGIQLVIDETTGKPVYKFYHLPLSAKPLLEQRNAKLPKNLQLKLEVVKGQPPIAPGPSANELSLQAELDKLKKELAKVKKNEKTPQDTL